MLYLGVDPGRVNGAAVAIGRLDGRWRVVWQRAWSKARPVDFAGLCLPEGVVAAAVEGVFVGPARQQSVGIAESAGQWCAMLAMAYACPVARPVASQWRPAVLGLGAAARASQADKRARQVVGLVIEGELDGPHAVDAACLALYAAGVRAKRAPRRGQ